MAASSVLAFWAVAVLLIAVPGPDWAFVLGPGLRGRTAVPAVGGLVLGYGAITVVVAAGVGAIVARSAALLTGLVLVGGLYLVWLGARTLARPKPPDALAGRGADAPADVGRATLAKGIGVSALNPKGLLVFVALLPQFTSARWSWPLPVQLGLLGLVFMVSCAAFYLCLGKFARRLLQARPAAARAIVRFSGAAMIVIGTLLLIERLAA
jgi:threonine/homoserine/homoserine lactone efflux protein